MIYDFCYYLAVSGSFCMLTAGFLYKYKRPIFMKIVQNISIHGAYVLNDVYDLYNSYYPSTIDKLEKDVSANNIITYIENKSQTQMSTSFPEEYDLAMVRKKIDDKVFCKRVENFNIDKLDFTHIDKQFLQIEYKQGDTTIELQEHMEYFYLKDNKILDNIFLKWYLKYWYNIELEPDYKLHIIDNQINIFILEPNQYIVFGENKYEIKDN